MILIIIYLFNNSIWINIIIMQEVSIISSNSSLQNFRSKGTSKAGRIQKGVVQDAHKKILTSCIPSKFETIVMKNDG
jgi:hypothetical protein